MISTATTPDIIRQVLGDISTAEDNGGQAGSAIASGHDFTNVEPRDAGDGFCQTHDIDRPSGDKAQVDSSFALNATIYGFNSGDLYYVGAGALFGVMGKVEGVQEGTSQDPQREFDDYWHMIGPETHNPKVTSAFDNDFNSDANAVDNGYIGEMDDNFDDPTNQSGVWDMYVSTSDYPSIIG